MAGNPILGEMVGEYAGEQLIGHGFAFHGRGRGRIEPSINAIAQTNTMFLQPTHPAIQNAFYDKRGIGYHAA